MRSKINRHFKLGGVYGSIIVGKVAFVFKYVQRSSPIFGRRPALVLGQRAWAHSWTHAFNASPKAVWGTQSFHTAQQCLWGGLVVPLVYAGLFFVVAFCLVVATIRLPLSSADSLFPAKHVFY